jgi:hypothetical protein
MPLAHYREVVVQKDGEISVEGLPCRAGEKVEIVVIRHGAIASNGPRYPLHGKPIEYIDPFASATDPEEWEAK